MITFDPVAVFESERPRITGLAYRLLGSLADAEDVVQEAWIKWADADHDGIERPAAWLTTVTSRLGLDRLRSRRRERIEYVGPWLPEPLVTASEPDEVAELSDSLTTTFLLALELLNPEERLVVLLADVFGEPLSSVAPMIGKSPAACRQMAVRARRKLRDGSAAAADRTAAGIAAELAAAVVAGDVDAVTRLVAPSVVLISDGGGERHAARRPVVGAHRVVRFLVNVATRLDPSMTVVAVRMNGLPAMLVRDAEHQPFSLMAVEVVDNLVQRVLIVSNPSKLTSVDRHISLS